MKELKAITGLALVIIGGFTTTMIITGFSISYITWDWTILDWSDFRALTFSVPTLVWGSYWVKNNFNSLTNP